MSFGDSNISEICYNFIREILPEGKTILELGSGWGTSALAKHYKMISIEHDDKWVGEYDSDYIYAPVQWYDNNWTTPDIPGNDGWYNVSMMKIHLLDKKYDMILVDGPPGYPNYLGSGKRIGRGGFYKHLDLFNTDVPIIIDDVKRKAERILMERVSKKLNRPYLVLEDEDTGVIQ